MIILIADDSREKIDFIRSMLTHFGWHDEPLIAMTTEQAMQLIDEHPITHAFIDFYIPTQNGPAIIRHLKNKRPDARCVLVSSSDQASNFKEAMDAGAEKCICTTYEMDTVEQAFSDLLTEWAATE